MTSRERILTALSHREPDRVPIDFGAHRSSGIAAMAYPRLRAALGLPPRPVYVYDPIQQLAIIDHDVLDWASADAIELGRGFCQDEGWWADWTLPDGTPCKMPVWALPGRRGDEWVFHAPAGHVMARMPAGSAHFDQAWWPFRDGEEDLARIEPLYAEHMWTGIASPPGPSISSMAELREGARKLRASTDRAIVGLFGGNLLEMGQFYYRMDGFLMLLGEDPARAHRFLDALVEIHLRRLEAYLGVVGEFIDIINFGDDLGAQKGPQISPRMYREYFAPRHAAMWARAKQLAPQVKVMLHCCGGVRPLLPELITAGLDVINPVQVSCRGMEAEALKRDFGKDLAFWGGGCDTQTVLPGATTDKVREHVRRQVEVMSPGGGFVFQQVHNIQADVPAQNIIAMFETLRSVIS